MGRHLAIFGAAIALVWSVSIAGVGIDSAAARPMAYPIGYPPHDCNFNRQNDCWTDPDTGARYQCLCYINDYGQMDCKWYFVGY